MKGNLKIQKTRLEAKIVNLEMQLKNLGKVKTFKASSKVLAKRLKDKQKALKKLQQEVKNCVASVLSWELNCHKKRLSDIKKKL